MPSHVAGLLSNTCATKTLVSGVESGYMNDMEEKAVMIMFSFLGMVSVFKLFSLVMFVNFLFLEKLFVHYFPLVCSVFGVNVFFCASRGIFVLF